MELQIQNIYLVERDCVVQGRIGYEARLDFQALDPEGRRLDFTIRRKEKDCGEKKQCRFELVASGVECQRFLLVVCADGRKYEQEISMTAAGQQVQDSIFFMVKKALRYLKYKGAGALVQKVGKRLGQREPGVDYESWRLRHMAGAEELRRQREERFPLMPKISLVVPLYHTREEYLNALVTSVQEQSYSNWELCLSDGSGRAKPQEGSGSEESSDNSAGSGESSGLARLCRRLRESDERILYLGCGEPLSISENTNRAINAASGEWIAFLDHDDMLAPEALYEVVKRLNEEPEAELIYTDEDKVSMDGARYFEPHFKPDFNPDLLCSMNYICHFVAVGRGLVERAGGLNPEYDGAQDHEFLLRCSELTDEIFHIPKILYHWRAHEASTSENPDSKRYAFEAGARAVGAHYRRLGIPAKVSQGQYPGQYRTDYLWEGEPLISVLIPNKDHREDLETCIRSLEEKSSYRNLEYIIIENNSEDPETFRFYEEIQAKNKRIRVAGFEGAFNYAKINNYGAALAKGKYLLFLNNDTELIEADGIARMLGRLRRPKVGAVGAKLLYPDDTIQHAGVIIGMRGIAGHAFAGQRATDPGYFSRAVCAQDYSAVTAACMMTKREVFDEVGGFWEELGVAFNDIDYCLKVRQSGRLVVYEPGARLYHHESKSRGRENSAEKVERFRREIELFEGRWKELLAAGDPYYNPNLTLEREDFSLKPATERGH